jgi:hypothetical protein
MEPNISTIVWNQYGAAMDMLADVIRACPEPAWTVALWPDTDDARYGQFWFIAYHAIYYIDLYHKGNGQGFAPPAPFLKRALPEHPYTKEQVLGYLDHCRTKCRATLAALTAEQAQQRCVFGWIEASYIELQIYAMRHVQEHSSQLGLALGQQEVTGFDWLTRARA